MKIIERVEIEAVTDVKCDVCRRSTRSEIDGLQFATLQAHWGFGTKHDGERYELHLCENCFFGTMLMLSFGRLVIVIVHRGPRMGVGARVAVTRAWAR